MLSPVSARDFSVKMGRHFLLLLFLLGCPLGESRDLRSGLQSQDRGGSLGHSVCVGGVQAGLSLDYIYMGGEASL